MNRLTTVSRVVTIGGVVALVFAWACYAAGARINTTISIPMGLYWTTNQAVKKGAYVMFCPPQGAVFDMAKARGYIDAGFCAGGYGYLMKKVLAAKDDRVSISDDGVRVNGALVPFSKPFKSDGEGRPMPRLPRTEITLAPNQLLLMSDICLISFDGRYFGPIDKQQIKWAIRPVLTW